jgi:hypothetical protein
VLLDPQAQLGLQVLLAVMVPQEQRALPVLVPRERLVFKVPLAQQEPRVSLELTVPLVPRDLQVFKVLPGLLAQLVRQEQMVPQELRVRRELLVLTELLALQVQQELRVLAPLVLMVRQGLPEQQAQLV